MWHDTLEPNEHQMLSSKIVLGDNLLKKTHPIESIKVCGIENLINEGKKWENKAENFFPKTNG